MSEYFFITDEQREEILETIGVGSVEKLFSGIPEHLQLKRPLNLPAALCEADLERTARRLAAKNSGIGRLTCFAGGGAYDHFIPAVVDEITSRGEYYTAYTPYQAEASQGLLQAFFEFQSMICQMTKMEVSNASLYEGATSVSEAAFMAMRVTNRHSKAVIPESLHPEYRAVLKTYLHRLNCELVTLPAPDGFVDPDDVRNALDDQTACLVLQHPNFWGHLEEIEDCFEAARAVGALTVHVFDPISLGVLKRPGDYDADIAVAEGQSLGTPLQYGGPYLGLFTCKQKYVRKMPGRLIGVTKDRRGNPCYALNLQAREQHIRRDKATSNICTNQGLMALRACVYLAQLGPQGLRELSELCFRKTHYLADLLSRIEGLAPAFRRPFLREFVLQVEKDANRLQQDLMQAGFLAGPVVDLGQGSANGLLITCTEKRTKAEIDQFAVTLAQSLGSEVAAPDSESFEPAHV